VISNDELLRELAAASARYLDGTQPSAEEGSELLRSLEFVLGRLLEQDSNVEPDDAAVDGIVPGPIKRRGSESLSIRAGADLYFGGALCPVQADLAFGPATSTIFFGDGNRYPYRPAEAWQAYDLPFPEERDKWERIFEIELPTRAETNT
jgi:hypothetical protein